MSEQMQSLDLVTRERVAFAVGDLTQKRVPFALTGELIRAKDGTLFFSNLTAVQIDGKSVKMGDSFAVNDNGVGKKLRVKLSISDSTKEFVPRAAVLPGTNVDASSV